MKLILSCFLCVLFTACAQTGQREIASVGKVVRLPGVLFKTSIAVSFDETTTHKYQKELAEKKPGVLKDILTMRLNRSHRKAQKRARVVGLKFCTDRGFESIGAVFWTRKSVTGVHCLHNHKDRQKILAGSYGAGCNALGIKSRPCLRASVRHKSKRFKTVQDVRRSSLENSASSLD